MAVLLVSYTNIDTKPFLLWCYQNETAAIRDLSSLDVTFCQYPKNTSLPSCWNPGEKGLHHKIRICGEEQIENNIRFGLLALIVITSLLSALASYHLHKISDYIILYKKTKKILFCVPTTPEVHRSAIFRLSKDDANQGELREMLERSSRGKKHSNPMVNRPNSEGETLLHNSTMAGANKCTEVLLLAGAIPQRNSNNKFPQIDVHLNNQQVLTKLQSLKEAKLLPNYILIELKRQTKGISLSPSTSDQLTKLLALEGSGNYISKQDCTIWSYSTEAISLKPIHVKKSELVEVRNSMKCNHLSDSFC